MKVLHAGVCWVVLISLAGCSAVNLGGKQIDYGAAAVKLPTLEVPPGLSSPETDDRYKVAGGAATYSTFSKQETAPVAKSEVLPVVKGVSLEHEGAKRWLKVDDKAENVWPVVKAFLNEVGLKIKSEDQAGAVIETEWAENRAKIPQDGLRSVFGKVFDGLYSSGQQDQYRIRLQRSQDGLSTEIYLTQYGKEEIMSADGNMTHWQSRPSDHEIEAEMLQRLMVRFGGMPANAAIASTAEDGSVAGGAKLLPVVDGSSVMVIKDAFDKSWRRVGLAIEHAGLVVEDKDREKGIYFLANVKQKQGIVAKLEFWKSEPDSNLSYRVIVKDDGAFCEVSVTDQNGASSAASRQKLEEIYKNINQ